LIIKIKGKSITNFRIQKDKFNSADLKLLKTGLTEFSVFYENTEKFSHEKK
jgi:hypothetical protein